eukprot:gene14452-biopygen12671
MLMNRIWLIAVLGLVATGCDRTPKPIDPALAPKLQALATKACFCEQAAPTTDGKLACWRDYDRLGKASVDSQFMTSCVPINEAGDNYNSNTPQAFSINTGHTSGIGKLCTETEVRAVGAAWQRAMDANLSGSAMEAEMRNALKDVKAGKAVAVTGGGCDAG